MKKPEKLINGIHLLSSGLYFIARIIAVFVVINLIVQIFNDRSDYTEKNIKAKQEASITLDKQCDTKSDAYIAGFEDAEDSNDSLYEKVTSAMYLNNQTIAERIVNSLLGIMGGGLLLLYLREIKRLFKRLNELVKKNEWFCISIYKSLMRLVYISLIFIITLTLLSLWQNYFSTSFDLWGRQIRFIKWEDLISAIFDLAISFIIASIYKAGVDIHEEQMLTV